MGFDFVEVDWVVCVFDKSCNVLEELMVKVVHNFNGVCFLIWKSEAALLVAMCLQLLRSAK